MTANHNIPNPELTQLTDFVKKLTERYQPVLLVSFGYSATLKISNGSFIATSITSNHEHHLLMITETNAKISHEVQEFADVHYKDGSICILSHGMKTVTEALEKDHRGFKTILRDGCLLYSKGVISPLFLSITHSDIDADLLMEQYERSNLFAKGFLGAAKLSLEEANYDLALFLMHQSVEQCTIMLIRVFMGYRSQLHNLKRQLQLCNSFSPKPYQHFLSGGSENKRLFDILVKSYANARYKDEYIVNQADAEAIFIRVSTFHKLTELMCKDQIAVLQKKAE